MEDPLVSVILCFLNPGIWLDEAIKSVLTQTYSRWELILVNDGSTDIDSKRAEAYAQALPATIKYFHHPGKCNIGLAASRNLGIKHASGSYIAFLDADDYWFPQKLAHQISLFNCFSTASMICEASQFWYSWQDSLAPDPIIRVGAPEGLYDPGVLIKWLYPLHTGQPPCPSGMIVKRNVFPHSDFFEQAFSGIFQLYEDQAFLAKMYLTQVIYISATPNNKYRKHEGSMTSAGNDPVLYATVRNFYLDWLEIYMKENRIMNSEVQSLILKARLPVALGSPV